MLLGLKSRYYWLVLFGLVGILFILIFININKVTLIPFDTLREFDALYGLEESHNYLLSDLVLLLYPNYEFSIRSLAQGVFPFWNPHLLSGVPFFADSQTQVLELTHLLGFLFNVSPIVFPLFSSLITIGLLWIFTYLYLRNLNFTRIVSIGMSLVLCLSGPVIVWLGYPLLSAFIWLPLILLSVDKIIVGQIYPWAGILALSTALSFFAGYPPISLILGLVVVPYFMFRIVFNKGSLIQKLKPLSLIIISGLVGIMLSAIQLGPAINLISQSEAYDVGRGSRAKTEVKVVFDEEFTKIDNSLEKFGDRFRGLGVLAIKPLYYGSPQNRDYKYPLDNGYNNFSEVTIYVGLLVLIAAFIALLNLSNIFVLFWVIVGWLSFAIATQLPFFDLLSYLPLLDRISISRFRLLFAFSLVVLAGYTLNLLHQKFLKKSIGKRRLISFFIIIIILISVVDLINVFGSYHRIQKADRTFIDNNLIVKYLKEHTRVGRVTSIGNYGAGFTTALVPNSALSIGLYDIRGYSPLLTREFTTAVDNFFERRGSFVLTEAPTSTRFFDFFGVRYAICPREDCSLNRGLTPWLNEYSIDDLAVIRNQQALPRAFIASSVIYSSSVANALSWFMDPKSNYRLQVAINAKVNDFTQHLSNTPREFIPAEIKLYSPNRVLIKTNNNDNGLLVLTDAFDPGWRAWVNGKEKPIYRVNGLVRGVAISSGENFIEFRYLPKGFLFYTIISSISLLIVLIFILCGSRKFNKSNN